MGISWSSNRRRNNYVQNPPPHMIQSSHYYASDPSTNPNYAYPSNPSYPPPPLPQYPPHNMYPSHPPPPPPLPPPPLPGTTAVYSPYYTSNPYNSCSYANPVVNRSNYTPYYANLPNGWAPVRPPMIMAQSPAAAAPPYVDHPNAKKVRNDVNVHKDTLRVEIDEQNPDHHLVSFVFDALHDGSITILYFAKEEPNCRFEPLFPEASMPVRIPFQKGLGQKFQQPSGTGIDLGFFELDDLSTPSPGEDVYPLIISAETWPPSDLTTEHSGDPVPSTSHMQITQAVLVKNDGAPFQVKVIRQILWIDEVRYELREIYGIGSSEAAGSSDNDASKDCVICMTEPKDTAVLPCRHMCMCSECAKALRLQSNKCPICRQPIEELMEIKIATSDQ